jgi:hypothetical protein
MRAKKLTRVLHFMVVGFIIADALLAVSPAAADDGKTCNSLSNVEVIISACTRAIDAGRHTAQDAATLYISRAIALAVNRQDARSSDDFNHAVRLDPQFAQADRATPVDVGDGQFIVCCRAIVNDCRAHILWRLRDTQGSAHAQCIETCLKKMRCY